MKSNEHKILRQLEFIKVRDGAMPKPLLLERDENFLLDITDEEAADLAASMLADPYETEVDDKRSWDT